MEINIKPEEIDVYVKQAIIESSIGKIINDSAKKYMTEFVCQSYDSPIKRILQEVVRKMLEAEMNKPENIQIILEEFNKQFNKTIITAVIEKTINKFYLSFPEK